MSSLTLYGFPPSTYTQTALLVAREAGASVDVQPLEFKQASHLALHPYGKMPILEHDTGKGGKLRLFETLAISSYVDRVFNGGKLQPTAPAAHATMLQWISVAIDYAYTDLVSALHGDSPGPDAVTAAGGQLKLLDRGLGDRPYFAGSEPSLADLFLYPMVDFAVTKLGEASLRGLPSLLQWRRSMGTRPSARKAA